MYVYVPLPYTCTVACNCKVVIPWHYRYSNFVAIYLLPKKQTLTPVAALFVSILFSDLECRRPRAHTTLATSSDSNGAEGQVLVGLGVGVARHCHSLSGHDCRIDVA